jgi:hypothetical protein
MADNYLRMLRGLCAERRTAAIRPGHPEDSERNGAAEETIQGNASIVFRK